jgi:hypothetical protein
MNKMVEMGLFTNWGNTGTHNLKQNKDTLFDRVIAFLLSPFSKGSNTDYRGSVGTIFEGMQFIYDENKNLVLDSVNKGSFDTSSPDRDKGMHYIDDVHPWLTYGNGPADKKEDVVIGKDKWNKIESIYDKFSKGEISREQAAADVQRIFVPSE